MDLKDVNLKEVKSKIKIVSADAVINQKVLSAISNDRDCFGVDYIEAHSECERCSVPADVDGTIEPLNVFCKELSDNYKARKQVLAEKREKDKAESATESVVEKEPEKLDVEKEIEEISQKLAVEDQKMREEMEVLKRTGKIRGIRKEIRKMFLDGKTKAEILREGVALYVHAGLLTPVAERTASRTYYWVKWSHKRGFDQTNEKNTRK